MEMTDADWAKAERIARELASGVDRNELGKIVAYTHQVQDTGKLLNLVGRLPYSGYVRSGRTRDYLRQIARVLRKELADVEGERARLILGWAFRLMTTYQTEQGTRTSTGRYGR